MELLQLKYFCDAARTQNFSKTARKYLVPTSNISQSVKRLERELGAELFEHRANKILLSSEGMAFYDKVSLALSLIDEARADIMQGDNEISGEINLLISCNRRIVTKAIERFKESYPSVSFVLRHEQEILTDCDILISDKCPEGYIKRGTLVKEDILLAMNKTHRLANKELITPCELLDERFISMPRGRSLYSLTNEICNDAGFIPNITIQTDDPYYVRKYVELGLGIAFIPSCSWEGLFSDSVVLKQVGSYQRDTYICLPARRKSKPAVEAFLNLLSRCNEDESNY